MSAMGASQRGNTLVGFIVGLVIGLALAVGVALYVTKAPVPFINKVGHPPDSPPPEAGKLPDPNRSLYSHDGSDTAPGAAPPAATPPLSVVPVAPPASTSAPKPAANAPGTQAASGTLAANAAKPNTPAGTGASPAVVPPAVGADGVPTYLQVGAYRSLDDAEGMKGKLALLGFEAIVTNVERDGATVYRVRLGPYARVDDLNRVRQRLTQNGVDTSLVSAAKAAL